jgi:hypothetical protein
MSKVPIVIASAFGIGGLALIIINGLPALAASLLCSGSALGLSASLSVKLRYRLGLNAGLRIGRALGHQDAARRIP